MSDTETHNLVNILSILRVARGPLLESEVPRDGSSWAFFFSRVDLAFIFPLQPPGWMKKQENTGEKSGQLSAPWRAPTNKIKKPESRL